MIRGKSAGAEPLLCKDDSDCKKARMIDRQCALLRAVLDLKNTMTMLVESRKSR